MTSPIIWVHGDCLRPNNPALAHAPTAPAIFVWDDELLAHYRISLKRLVFMYEALLEMPVTLMRGNVPDQVCTFARQHAASHIITTHTVAPRFADHLQQIRRHYRVEVVNEEPFVDIPAQTDIRRFSRYWVAAAKSLRDSS